MNNPSARLVQVRHWFDYGRKPDLSVSLDWTKWHPAELHRSIVHDRGEQGGSYGAAYEKAKALSGNLVGLVHRFTRSSPPLLKHDQCVEKSSSFNKPVPGIKQKTVLIITPSPSFSDNTSITLARLTTNLTFAD